MKVLHLVATLSPSHGGPSKVVPAMCEALVSRGHHAEIMTTTWRGPGSDLPQGVPVNYYKVSRPRTYGTSWPLAVSLSRRVREFDVIHVHQIYFFHGVLARLNCVRAGIPLVISPHGVLDPFHRKDHPLKKAAYTIFVERNNLARASCFHYASQAEREHAETAGLHGRGFVIPLAVPMPPPEVSAKPLYKRFPELANKLIVTFLGRLTSKKRLDLVIDAFAQLAGDNPDFHLVVAGPDGEGLGALLWGQVQSLGLNERVTMAGLVAGELKAALLEASRVLVLPSEDESFGLVVVEAMAAGVPVVISDRVAVFKEVISADAGIVVDRQADAVAAAICNAAEEKSNRRMGANGRSLVRSAYSPAAMSGRLEEMYAKAISEGLRKRFPVQLR